VKTAFETLYGDFFTHNIIKAKIPAFLAGILFMLVCLFIQFLTKGSRSIYKIVAKVKEAMVAFVYH